MSRGCGRIQTPFCLFLCMFGILHLRQVPVPSLRDGFLSRNPGLLGDQMSSTTSPAMPCELGVPPRLAARSSNSALPTPDTQRYTLQPYFYDVIFSDNKISIKSLWGKPYIKVIINQKIKITFQIHIASVTKEIFIRTGELLSTPEF